jgi:hypothetical protein
MASRSLLAVAGLALGTLALSACSSGPGSEEDLIAALTRDDSFTQAQAECIAERVFDQYGEDEEALGLISGAGSYEDLTGTEGVPGFDEFFTTTISVCTF